MWEGGERGQKNEKMWEMAERQKNDNFWRWEIGFQNITNMVIIILEPRDFIP